MNSSSRLDAYHDQLLGADERAAFERELETSPTLRAELALQRDVDLRLKQRFAPSASATAKRGSHQAFAYALAAALLVAAGLAWRAFSAPHSTPPPSGAASWCAWVGEARTHVRALDVAGCTVVAPVDPNAPLGPVPLGGALFLPMGWRAEVLELALPTEQSAWRVIARDGREAVLLLGPAGGAPTRIAPEPGLSSARRELAGLEVVELVTGGPTFVLGALSAGE